MLTPYPPGIPAVLPGEVLDRAVVEYLRTGVHAGMLVPDATDPTIATIRVSTRDVGADCLSLHVGHLEGNCPDYVPEFAMLGVPEFFGYPERSEAGHTYGRPSGSSGNRGA